MLSKSEPLKALEFLCIFNFSFWSRLVFTHWTKHVQRRKVPVASVLLLVPKPHCSYLGTLKPFVGKPCKFLMLLDWRHCTAGWHFLLSEGPPVRATVSVWTAFGSIPVLWCLSVGPVQGSSLSKLLGGQSQHFDVFSMGISTSWCVY